MRRAVDIAGRALVTTGLLLLLFVTYQMWGTGLIEAREQSDLKADFRETLAASSGAPAPEPLPGAAVALLEIPRIGLERAVVEGVGTSDLRKGPGHYPGTVLPGERGNAALAGHRTTYGAPFNDLDELEGGDPIEVTTTEGRFVYRVREQLVVTPEATQVLGPTVRNQLTLTTCHPKFSARQRLVVIAELDGRASAEPVEAAQPPQPVAAIEDLDGGEGSGWSAVDLGLLAWTAALLLIGAGWWLLHRNARHRSLTLVGAMPFLPVLFFFFGELEQFLPSNF